ncbi:MAG: 3-phosphoglycerate dehydrogenase [Candidatus Bathyarchaeota archaeon B24]|nr:MAG: 3-phosphoglycerate dehydrogenase [Candidatus Bathyarchaeota archaeon B24]
MKAYELDQGEFAKLLKDADVVVVRSRRRLDRCTIDRAPRLKVIARAGVGLDNVDVDYAVKRGITLLSTGDASTEAVAELTIGLMIALARRITELDRKMKRGNWCKNSGAGVELRGKTLGIIGLGRIGSRVAELARVFGMRVVAYDPYVSREKAERLGVELKQRLEDLLRESDFVSIHAVLTEETEGMIGERELRLMKPTAYLVNTARGAIVDEEALVRALEGGWIAGAALDVYEREPPSSRLAGLENVILTPHVGASTVEAQKRIARVLAEKILVALENIGEMGESP